MIPRNQHLLWNSVFRFLFSAVSSFSFILHPSSLILFLALSLLPVSLSTASDRLLIISPHPEATLYEYDWAFRPWYRERTGRDIEIIWLDQGGTSKMLRFLYNEFQRSPDGVEIDMVWGGGMDPYFGLAPRNLLHAHRLPEPVLKAIPPDCAGIPNYDPQYRWYGTAITGFGIIYNRRVLAIQGLPTPQTWTDLMNPAFQGWVGSADPRQSGSAHMSFEILLQAFGWDKGWEVLTLLAGNIHSFSRLASDVPRDITLGQIAAGFCIDNYAYSQIAIAGKDVVGYVMPEGLTVMNPDGIAILKGAPNLQAAKLFLEFVVSEPGQRLLMTPKGRPGGPRQFNLSRMAVRPDIYEKLGGESLIAVNPFRLKATVNYDAAKGSTRWKLLNDLIGVLLIENHDRLIRACRALATATPERRADLTRRLTRMPLDEQEGLAFAAKTWNDPVARNKIMVDWSAFATAKYDHIISDMK